MLGLPKTLHPMSQLSIGLMHLQEHSHFAKAYRDGIHKNKLWEHAYEDSLDVIAKSATLSALIYRHTYKEGKLIDSDPNLDLAGNYAH